MLTQAFNSNSSNNVFILSVLLLVLVKGKAIPVLALTGPQGFRRLRLPDFKKIDT
jgi:hypothetical protein